jgi:hypothetical protein
MGSDHYISYKTEKSPEYKGFQLNHTLLNYRFPNIVPGSEQKLKRLSWRFNFGGARGNQTALISVRIRTTEACFWRGRQKQPIRQLAEVPRQNFPQKILAEGEIPARGADKSCESDPPPSQGGSDLRISRKNTAQSLWIQPPSVLFCNEPRIVIRHFKR